MNAKAVLDLSAQRPRRLPAADPFGYPAPVPAIHQIGPFRFDAEGDAIWRDGVATKLEHRAARTLALLCERRGEVVSADELLQAVWMGRSVSPNSLAVVIGALRRALGDDAREPNFIVTVAKRGYRLNAAPAMQTPPAVSTGRLHRWRTKTLMGLAGLSVAACLVILAGAMFGPRPERLVVDAVRNDTGSSAYDPLTRALGELVINRTSRMRGVRVQQAPPAAAAAGLRLQARLIVWNHLPTLSLTLVRGRAGEVMWADMAEGPADVIALHTLASLRELALRLQAHDMAAQPSGGAPRRI